MTRENAEQVAAIAKGLTKAQRDQLPMYEPNVRYGIACPYKASASVKGRLTTLGLLERIWLREIRGSADHALTPLGLAVRQHLLSETTHEA